MIIKNYYEIMGISQFATQEEIKNAYTGIVKTYHSNISLFSCTNEAISKLTEAYDVLSNIDKRMEYDKILTPQANTALKNSAYESYVKTIEESESDFALWLKEYLKRERENYECNIYDRCQLETDYLKALKREMKNGSGLYESLMKILGNNDESYIKDSIIVKKKSL